MEEKKPIVRKSDWIILAICLAVIAYVLVDQGGCYMVKKTEKLEWVD
jgi:hypothetical protein